MVETDLYTKPTDKHQYLLQSSCHSLHTKRAIPFNLALRLRRICSSDESFTLRANELIQYLNDRGYNLSFLRKEIQRVHAITRNETLKPSQSTTSQPSRVPLVITYNPALRCILTITRSIERFSIERRKTKTKVITLANHQSHKHYSEPIKTRSNYM